MKILKALSLFLFLFLPTSIWAEKEIPYLSSPVIDEPNLLDATGAEQLRQLLQAQKEIAQIQIWIVSSLEGESIEGLSIRAVDQWKLGGRETDNGVLILVAPQERRIRIEVGQGLEGVLPDVLAGRIIDGIIRPGFRAEKYSQALNDSVRTIHGLVAGDAELRARLEATPKRSGLGALGNIFFILFIVIFAGLSMLSRLLRLGSRGRPYSGYSGTSWGGTSWGGGGGWSGGGGGFSGGGASGSW